MPTTHSITESQILTSYLLPPSPLPTILPYQSFLTLIPSTYRNDPSCKPALKRLYRDLQFQRDVIITQVQDNIERECEGRAGILRAELARRIAIEEGEEREDDGGRRTKRRRIQRDLDYHDDNEDEDTNDEDQTNDDDDDDDNGDDSNMKEESSDSSLSSNDEDEDPLNPTQHKLQTHLTFHAAPSRQHPATSTLPIPPDLLSTRIRSGHRGAHSQYHTRQSLLTAMDHACKDLDAEIGQLERECDGVKREIAEVVGGLSDLRYGRVHKSAEGAADGMGKGEYADVLEALNQFRQILKSDHPL